MKKLLASLLLLLMALGSPVLADTKISQLGTVTTVTGSEELPVNQAGTTKKITVDQVSIYTGAPAHISNQAVHRQINDAGTATTDLWSADKINTQLGTKSDKVGGATNGNFAGLNASGNLTDSGSKAADFATAGHSHNASDITSGTVSIVRGGTGAATANDAITNLLPSQGGNSGKFLTTNGTSASWGSPSSTFPNGYLAGPAVKYASAATVTIPSGVKARSSNNTTDIVVTADRTCNFATSGANGLDTGAEASSTWYYVYVIDDSAGVTTEACLLSASSSSPTLPSGYDVSRRLASIRNDGSSNIRPFFARLMGNTLEVQYNVHFVVQNGGTTTSGPTTVLNATSSLATTFTDVALSSFVPPTSTLALLNVTHTFASVATSNWRGKGETHDGQEVMTTGAGDKAQVIFWIPTDSSQIIEYKVSSSTMRTLTNVRGYSEVL